VKANAYESERYLHEYLLLHYGRAREVCPLPLFPEAFFRFHERLRQECLLPMPRGAVTRALDLGCGVGRFTFELGRVAATALGIDNSRRFIAAARRMARRRACSVRLQETGAAFRRQKLVLPRSLRSSKVEFRVGDAIELEQFAAGAFHIVAAVNLICRIPQPRRFLRGLHRLVAPGGQLLIASPFSWLKQYSVTREWLTAADVERLLHPHFKLLRRRELPFLLREHRRKYQLVISEVLVFQKITS
jgi:SAM-dependent methyltransferase